MNIRKCISAVLLAAMLFAAGCSRKDYIFDSDDSNLIGLKSINVEEEYIEFEIDEDLTDEEYNVAAWFVNAPEKYCKSAWYHVSRDSKNKTSDDIEIEQTDNGYILRVYCDNPEDVESIFFQDVSIRNMSSPRIEIELAGGEIIQYFRQSYDTDKGAWSKVEQEDVFFPIEEN